MDRFRPRQWPQPGNGSAGQRLIERLAGTALLAEPGAEPLLRGLGEHSPYLSDLAAREPDTLHAVLRDGPDSVVGTAMDRLRAVPSTAGRVAVAQALRAAKRVVALAVAMADIGGIWTLDQVTVALSELAETALQAAVVHLLGAAESAGDLAGSRWGEPTGGFVVLAMGKLGARELNFSSDVDLMLLHEPQAARGANGSVLFTRIARDLVALMETRDQDGYVFRVDLRLRPDPAATPPSVAVPAAITYYEGMAQTWERAAMIKARPIAGDLALGASFLEAIRPFVWRRNLDFSAVADLHGMKQRIDAHKGTGRAAGLAGRDVKLGRGGIREIEFVAQTLQLVWGGRDPRLRRPQTVTVLRCLARTGHLPARAAAELIAAYIFLRRVEHRLQMVADRQTHSLPAEAAMAGFARFMAYADVAAFERVLARHLRRVEQRYGDVFVGERGASDVVDPRLLRELGFADPDAILMRLAAWRAGEARALRSERARLLLAAVLPDLLRALARQPQPDVAFARLDRFVGRLPAGVGLLSLFERNRALLDRFAAVLGAAAPLAEHLASTPSAIDGLLAPSGADDPQHVLHARLTDAGGLEEAIRIVQRTVREHDFSISLATLEARIDADEAGLRRAALADAAIVNLLPQVIADVERRHGSAPGGGVAVVLLGKAGGREMMAGSDLDLMLVYDNPSGQWFARLAHSLVAALTAPDAAGELYAIDMRLRPSGGKGPVAVSLEAFTHYHRPAGEAWTWERMALTRSRIVAGNGDAPARVEAAIRVALAGAGPPGQVRRDAVAMRVRLGREVAPSGPPFALRAGKLRPGGLVDVEFIAQSILLGHGLPTFDTRPTATRDVFATLAARGALSPADAALLIHADHAWRTVLGMLRLVAGRDGREPSGAAETAVLRAAERAGLDAVDGAALHATLDWLAEQVRERFARLVGPWEGAAR